MRIKEDPAVDLIINFMNEPQPLPMGRQEFEDWSDRIIQGALLPGGEESPEDFVLSQKFALANMLLHLGPTESHKPDAHFIHTLRKVSINQVAHARAQEIQSYMKAREEGKKDADVLQIVKDDAHV